jgi:hypothetical protein
MLKYLVVQVTTEAVDPDGHFEGSIDEEDAWSAEVKDVVLCADAAGVGEAIRKAGKKGLDWAVFEVIETWTKGVGAGSRTERRAVTFEKDGKTVREVA